MSNHYHLLLETPEANLVAGMKCLQGTYTQRYNHRHREHGNLFQGRYKAVVVEAEADEYFQVVSTLGLRVEALKDMSKAAPEKTALAGWLRGRTTVSLRWVTERLGMGHYSRVAQIVSGWKQQPTRRQEVLAGKLRRLE
jgi:hypothetical protein